MKFGWIHTYLIFDEDHRSFMIIFGFGKILRVYIFLYVYR